MLINYNKRKNKYYRLLHQYYDRTTEVLSLPCPDLEVNVIVVSPKSIRSLNAIHRNIDKVTDVLSFPNLASCSENSIVCPVLDKAHYAHDINPVTGNIMLGDIYICFRKVKQQAREYGNSVAREFCYLGVHGLLHLMGYDHIDPADKKLMREREEEILGGLK